MSNLLVKINNDLKQAMRDKDEAMTSTLRMLVSAIRNKEISLRQDGRAELADDQVLEVISGEIKKRRDSILAYEQGQRVDLADKEKAEISKLEKYMPEQLNDTEIEKIVREVAEQDMAKNFGKIMGQVMVRLKGRADGNRVGEIVKKIIS